MYKELGRTNLLHCTLNFSLNFVYTLGMFTLFTMFRRVHTCLSHEGRATLRVSSSTKETLEQSPLQALRSLTTVIVQELVFPS